MPGDSKTEKATPKKRRDERKKGNTFLSQDAVAVATLFGSTIVLRMTFAGMVAAIFEIFYYCFAQIVSITASGGEPPLDEILIQCVTVFAKTVGPLLAVTVVTAVAATMAQTKGLVSAALMKPKFSRISPLQGFKRLFSMRSVVEALKGIIKIIVLIYLIYSCIRSMITISPNFLYMDMDASCNYLLEQTFSLMLQVGVAFLVLAAADFGYQWWEYERQMKMTKQEIKEEYKQTEGDPQIKGKIKEQQRKMAQARMMQQVPKADVVIRNPTHFAVALRYKPKEDSAPVVLAKGQDALALRIVRVAEEHSVKVIENVELARGLYARAELDREIPPEFYEAVAEILVYLYKLGGKL